MDNGWQILAQEWTACVEKLLIHQRYVVLERDTKKHRYMKSKVYTFWERKQLEKVESFTDKPCRIVIALLQLGHLSELAGEENVLGYHRDLRRFITKGLNAKTGDRNVEKGKKLFASPGKAIRVPTASAACSGSTSLRFCQAAFSYRDDNIQNLHTKDGKEKKKVYFAF